MPGLLDQSYPGLLGQRSYGLLGDMPWVAQGGLSPHELAALRMRNAVQGRREGGTTRFLDSLGQSIYDTAARPSRIWNELQGVPAGQPLSERPDIVDAVAQTATDVVGMPALTGAVPRGALGSAAGSKISKQYPDELFHVVGDDYEIGSPLRTLYARYGNKAYDLFAERWPDAREMGQYHTNKTFFYDNLSDAKSHVENFGGRIVRIDPKKVDELKFDDLEKPGYWTTAHDVLPDPGFILGSNAADRPTAAALTGIRAYHGSPHDFDRFDMSKIGTGEGAQAYGHGLYFAENPAVAESYKKSFVPNNLHPLSPRNLWTPAELPNPKVPGRMYEVNINAKPDEFLDWDRPVLASSKNPALRDISRDTVPSGNPTGNELYNALALSRKSPALGAARMTGYATDALKDAGIPGIKYLDQGSRGSGQGTSNYVLFRDDIIDILRKYGLAGGLLGTGGSFATQDQM